MALFSILFNSFRDILFQGPEGLLCDFFPSEIISNDIVNKAGDVFISLGEIFIELIGDHLSQLFPLLDGLSFLYCGVNFATLSTSLRLGVVVLVG